MKSKFFIKLYKAQYHSAKSLQRLLQCPQLHPPDAHVLGTCWVLRNLLLFLPQAFILFPLPEMVFHLNMYKIHFSFHLDLCPTTTWPKFLGDSVVKNPFANASDAGPKKKKKKREMQVQYWAQKSSWRSKWQPTLVFLAGKSHGQRSLEHYSPWGCKESDTT